MTIEKIAEMTGEDVQSVVGRAWEIGLRGVWSLTKNLDSKAADRLLCSLRSEPSGWTDGFDLKFNYGVFFERHDLPKATALPNVTRRRSSEEEHQFHAARFKQIEDEGLDRVKEQIQCLELEATKLAETKPAFWEEDVKEVSAELINLEQAIFSHEDDRILAKLWKAAPDWSEEQKRLIYHKASADQEWLRLLSSSTVEGEAMTWMLFLKLKQALGILAERTQAGDQSSARMLASMAVEATRLLNDCQDEPNAHIEKIKKEFASWPVLFAPHPGFGNKSESLTAGVGDDVPFAFYSNARWDPNDLGSRISMELLEFTCTYRASVLKESRELTAFELRAAELPEIPRPPKTIPADVGAQWWGFARVLLCRTYLKSEAYPFIRRLSKSARELPKKASLCWRAERQIHDEIVDSIRQKFLNIGFKLRNG